MESRIARGIVIITSLAAWFAGGIALTAQTPLDTFRRCVGAQGTGDCQLPPGTYLVSTPIEVQRPVQILGNVAGQGAVILERDSDSGQIMQVGSDAATPLAGVTIKNVVFDGNSSQYSCPSHSCADLQVSNVCGSAASCQGNVSAVGGNYSVVITGSEFKNAPAHAVAFYSSQNHPVNDIFFTSNWVHDSIVTGLLVGGGDSNTFVQCDAGTHGIWYPSNITVDNDTFTGNHTGAIGVNATRYFNLTNSTFTNNYWQPPAFESPAGGSVFFDQCSDVVTIAGNTLVGPVGSPTSSTDGLELWGRNIVAQNNTIHDYPVEGISANSVYNLTLIGNTIYNNNLFSTTSQGAGWLAAGILVWNRVDHRRTQGVTIINDTSNNQGVTRQSYGVWLNTVDAVDNTISNVTIVNDNLYANAIGAYCAGPGVTLAGTNFIAYPSTCSGSSSAHSIPAINPGGVVYTGTYNSQSYVAIYGSNLGAPGLGQATFNCAGGNPNPGAALSYEGSGQINAFLVAPVGANLSCTVQAALTDGTQSNVSTSFSIPAGLTPSAMQGPVISSASARGCWGALVNGQNFYQGVMQVYLRDASWNLLQQVNPVQVNSGNQILFAIPPEIQDQFYSAGLRFTVVNSALNQWWTSDVIHCN
jgi:hypothetical protein